MIKYYLNKIIKKIICAPLVRKSCVHKTAKIWNDSQFINSSIDKYSYISDHTSVYYAEIGRYCSIASYVSIGGAAHPLGYVSTSPLFLKGQNPFRKNVAEIDYEPYKRTRIGNDVWIGTHSMIKSGVTISDGAVIGMGSVVTCDVGAYEIWIGNPAKFLRKRYSDDLVEKLLQIRWWEWSEEKIKKYSQYFDNPELLVKNEFTMKNEEW